MTVKRKVSIIGGGCAAMAAAFELSDPRHQGAFEITIYQQGWRLGGKGASGRALPTQRIEEHGLHLWMGFYENAFRMMRACYDELGRDPETYRIATFDQAFKPDNFVGVTEKTGPDGWQDWTALFPPAAGNPGDPLKSNDPFTIPGYLTRCVVLLRTLIASVQDQIPGQDLQGNEGLTRAVIDLCQSLGSEAARDPLGSVRRLASFGQLALGFVITEALDVLRWVFEPGGGRWRAQGGQTLTLLGQLSNVAHAQLEALADTNTELRRVWEIADVVLAIVRGILRDGLIFNPRGFDAIDDMDWRDWLAKHGASARALDAAFIRGCYDLLFAYENGDIERPRLAAGQALRGALRMFFTYRGALFWKMQAGMGDIVFAPFYEVLKQRGVRFEFFHRLEEVKLTETRDMVGALRFSQQAKIRGGKEFEPLVNIKGVPSWPAEPDPENSQIVNIKKLKAAGWDPESRWDDTKVGDKVLTAGEDFDFVVLAIGLGEVPNVAPELLAASPAWQRMVDEVKTVATQAFQVWLDKPAAELGWQKPPINISGYVEPFDTWADMTHLTDTEEWTRDPGSIAYFCSVLPDAEIATGPEALAATHEHVKLGAMRFLDRDVHHFWPAAVGPEGFDWSLLSVEGEQPEGKARFETQFWTANINPTDRYILSLPGTLQYRISPLDRHFDNLTIAGDWTRCGHQAGCVEAAVMSGQLAAHALSQFPRLEEIVGYDHP